MPGDGFACRFPEGCACDQCREELRGTGRQSADFDGIGWTGYQPVFGVARPYSLERPVFTACREDRDSGKPALDDARCRVGDEGRAGEVFGRDGAKAAGVQRIGVGCVKRIKPCPFQARHIRQVRISGQRLEAFEKSCKTAAIFKDHRRTRRLLGDVQPRHVAEEGLPDKSLDGREYAGKGVDQAHRHVVAVDGKALEGVLAVRTDNAFRQRQLGIEQGCAKIVLPGADLCFTPRHDATQAAMPAQAGREWRRRAALPCAAPAIPARHCPIRSVSAGRRPG